MSDLQWDATWLCIEDYPTTGFRVTNMPGGPGIGMCFFNGPRSPHLPDCGYVNLEAARKYANPDLEAAAQVFETAGYRNKGIRILLDKAVDAALGVTKDE